MIRLMLSSSNRKGSNPFPAYINQPLYVDFPMTSLFLEKDGDAIYEELEENKLEEMEDEYREDRMDQMISRYGY
jgi:hypothetical protein